MKFKFFLSMFLFLWLSAKIFSQETEIRKIFTVSKTESDIIKGSDHNTIYSTLSEFTEEEIGSFKEKLSLIKGIRSVSISPVNAPTYKCVLVLDKELKKRALIKILQSAGVENVAIDDVKCKIKDYVKIMEEKKRRESK